MVVKEFRTRNGVLVRLHDTMYRDLPPEELARRKEHTRRTVEECYLAKLEREERERQAAR